MAGQEYRKKSGTRTFHEHTSDHIVDITFMARSGIRVECSCGLWKDFPLEEEKDSTKFASNHIKDERIKIAKRRHELRKKALGQ